MAVEDREGGSTSNCRLFDVEFSVARGGEFSSFVDGCSATDDDAGVSFNAGGIGVLSDAIIVDGDVCGR